MFVRASHSLTGCPAESGSGGAPRGEMPKQLGARRCCRPHWYSVNNKTLQAVLTQIRQLTGNEAALPNEETDWHSVLAPSLRGTRREAVLERVIMRNYYAFHGLRSAHDG